MFEMNFWTWLIVAVVMVILEITIPIYYFLWLGITAAITGIITWVIPGLDITWQLLLFSVIGIASVLAGKTYLKMNREETSTSTLNRRADQYIGRLLTLEEPIIGGEAKHRVDGLTWKIIGPDCSAGTIVRVVSIHQKSAFIVEPADK